MDIIPNHRIKFECVNNQDAYLPDVINPVYVYKIDDEIKRYDLFDMDQNMNPKPLGIFRVTSVKHELMVTIDQMEQLIIVELSQILEDPKKS